MVHNQDKLIPVMPETSPFAACNYTRWAKEGFELEQALNLSSGPIIEIGGPTFTGYPNIFPDSKFVNILPDDRRMLISNIDFNENMPKDVPPEEFTKEDIYFFRRQSTRQYLDLLCKGESLPFADESVGILLFSHLPKWPYENVPGFTIAEASRVLKPNGLLVAQGILVPEIEYAKELGFSPKIIYSPENPRRTSDVVFRKGESA